MSNVSLSYCALDAVYCNMWPMSTGQLGILLSLHCAQFLNVFTSFDYKSKQHHCGRWWKSRSSIREKCGGGKGESVQAGVEKCWASVGWRRPVWPNIALLCATVCPRPVTGSVQHTLFYQRGSVAVWKRGCVAVWTKLCGLREKSHGWRYQATGLDRTLAASNKITREGKGVKTVDYCTLAYCHHLESLLSAG